MPNGSMLAMATAVVVGIIIYAFPDLHTDQDPPELRDDYFGKGIRPTDPEKFPKDNPAIRKFEIKVPNAVLEDLKDRLKKTRFVDPLEDVQFQYGFHASYLRKVVDYWLNKFDWRKQEKELNKYEHFITQIEGIDVHYMHVKPNVKGPKVKVIPLLLIHGWPGSIVEFQKILPMLTTPRKDQNFVFEVICPSIPGYGYSEAPHQTGFSVSDAARVFVKLMDRLHIEKFYVQGGDWGSAIGSDMAKVYPKRVTGLHVNVVFGYLSTVGWAKYCFGYLFPNALMSPEEAQRIYPITKTIYMILEEMGYAHIQATKPDTVAAALIDSPAGLAAYILEKFSSWTDMANRGHADGGLTKKFTMDELLTNVMVYWTTNSIASSARFYKERFSEDEQKYKLEKVPVKVPSGVAAFPNELTHFPRSLITPLMRNLVRYTLMPRGGHFPAMEEPQLLADEVFAFVHDVESSPKKAGEV